MRRLPVQLAFAVLMSLSLGALVPGHHLLAAALTGADHHHHHGDRDRHSSRHDESHCSICFFASTMSTSLDVAPSIAGHERLAVVHTLTTQQVLSIDFIPTFHGRAPPAAA